jgi:hypothetical protein
MLSECFNGLCSDHCYHHFLIGADEKLDAEAHVSRRWGTHYANKTFIKSSDSLFRFIIMPPTAADQPDLYPQEDHHSKLPVGTLRLAVQFVDDDRDAMQAIDTCLETFGYRFVEGVSGYPCFCCDAYDRCYLPTTGEEIKLTVEQEHALIAAVWAMVRLRAHANSVDVRLVTTLSECPDRLVDVIEGVIQPITPPPTGDTPDPLNDPNFKPQLEKGVFPGFF